MTSFYKKPFVLLVVILIGILLRFINITDGLGLDEIWSMITSGPGKSSMDIINACKMDTHPPFFDLLLHYFILLIGDTEFAGRILSIIVGILGLLSTYFYVEKITSNKLAAFISLLMVSFSFFHIYYSSEGRFYSLLYFLSIACICQLYLFLQDKKTSQILWFMLSSAVLVYTHYYGAILLFALGILVFVLWLFKKIKRKEFLSFCAAGLGILLIYAPWLPYMLKNETTDSWMSKPNLGYFFEYLYTYTGKNPLESLFILFALIVSVKLFKKNVVLYTLLYGSILLGFLIPFIVSTLSVPMLHSRYTIVYFPSLVLLTAIYWGETTMLKPKIRNIVFGTVFLSVLVNFFLINNYIKNPGSQPWREAAQYIAQTSEPNTAPIYSEQHFHMNYYLERNKIQPSQLPQDNLPEQFWYFRTSFDMIDYDFQKTHELIEQKDFGNDFYLAQFRKKAQE